jgi:hypothetical protein
MARDSPVSHFSRTAARLDEKVKLLLHEKGDLMEALRVALRVAQLYIPYRDAECPEELSANQAALAKARDTLIRSEGKPPRPFSAEASEILG